LAASSSAASFLSGTSLPTSAAGLVIELDGSQHAGVAGMADDRARSLLISVRGYRVIRFWNDDILTNLEGVLEQIFAELGQPPPGLPLVRGRD
jgi:very-short-patch-repair endonuclease